MIAPLLIGALCLQIELREAEFDREISGKVVMADKPAVSDWHEDKIRRRAEISFERCINLSGIIGPEGINTHAVRRMLDEAGVQMECIGDAERPQNYPLMNARLICGASNITGQYRRKLYLKDDNESLVLVERMLGKSGFEPISRTVDASNRWAAGLLQHAFLHA